MQAIVSLLDNPVDVVSLSTFSDLTKGAPAPHWLFRGVCGAWGIEPERAELNLITVSENATFVLLLDGRPEGVVRVSQPGYVGGPEAVASEIAWLAALHEIDGVRLIDPVPTVRGTFVTKIRDLNGVGWMVVSTKFVEGTVLEDLDDPSRYYRTIGEWSAKFHEQSRHWNRPFGFKRFNWGISDMVGASPRWGRWETADLSDTGRHLCERALDAALAVMNTYPRNSHTWGLIHADLRPSNIIRADNGDLTLRLRLVAQLRRAQALRPAARKSLARRVRERGRADVFRGTARHVGALDDPPPADARLDHEPPRRRAARRIGRRTGRRHRAMRAQLPRGRPVAAAVAAPKTHHPIHPTTQPNNQ